MTETSKMKKYLGDFEKYMAENENYIGAASQIDDPLNNQVTFTFNTGNLDWENIGLHWTMKCGNDVIEGVPPVPEPSTKFLLGSGLVGLGRIRGKSREHKKA